MTRLSPTRVSESHRPSTVLTPTASCVWRANPLVLSTVLCILLLLVFPCGLLLCELRVFLTREPKPGPIACHPLSQLRL